MLKRASQMWLVVIVVAWFFDFLFWEKAVGISFPVFVSLALAGGFYVMWREGVRPAFSSLLLVLPLGYFTLMSAVRLELFTRFVDFSFTLGLMALLAVTFQGGRWLVYGPIDYAWGIIQLVGSTFSRGLLLLTQPRKIEDVPNGQAQITTSAWGRVLPVLRGLVIALPIVVFFAALLASADLVFSRYLRDLLDFLNLEDLPEYLWRAFYILLLAYLLAGVYLHALFNSRDEKLIGYEKPLLPSFLGMTESAIVLGGVDLLFAAFVAIQFRYFFGGQANIHIDGYTYAEYARRGFAELVAVAFFSLLLFLGLSTIADRRTRRQRGWFSGLGLALVALVLVILASAFQRLLLYEQAYGFTRLRAYTHVFIVWLGLLLLTLVGLDLVKKLRYFWLAGVVAALGFGLTLNSLNVDVFIARQNVARALSGEEFDASYLTGLSADVIPVLIDLHSAGSLPEELKDRLGGVIACYDARRKQDQTPYPWQSFHFSRQRAIQWLEAYQPVLEDFPAYKDDNGALYVKVNGEVHYCTWGEWD
jgi:hypothetical protein